VRKLIRKLEDPLHDIAFSHYIDPSAGSKKLALSFRE